MPLQLTSCIISKSANARDLKFSLEMELIKKKICKFQDGCCLVSIMHAGG